MKDIAIIGAGLAGSFLANELQKNLNYNIHVFEKSRGPGGRAAYRKVVYGGKHIGIDHGAQFIETTNSEFISLLERSQSTEEWKNFKFIEIDADNLERKAFLIPNKIFIPKPQMNSLARELLRDVELLSESKVIKYTKDKQMILENGQNGSFDIVISTAPPAQSQEIMAEHKISNGLEKVQMHSQYAVLLCSDYQHDFEFDAAAVKNSIFNWISINNKRPGKSQEPLSIMLHTTPEWSKQNLIIDPKKLCQLALAELKKLTGFQDDKPGYISTHRWLYARPQATYSDSKYLWDPEAQVGICGDWFCGDNIEAAWLSASSLAKQIMN